MRQDPFKAMARECDNRIVARGGESIFGIPWLERPTLGIPFYSAPMKGSAARVIPPPHKYPNDRLDD